MAKFERLGRKLVHNGAILDIYQDEVITPNGNKTYYDFIKHKGAAAVVPVLEDGRILMVHQFRNAIDRETIEIPAGGLDSVNEAPYDCAMRELKEETGYEADHLEELITIYTTVAFCNERIPIFVAFIKGKAGEQHLDENEFINVKAYSVEELEEMIYSGKLNDSKTVAAILAYKNKYLAKDRNKK